MGGLGYVVHCWNTKVSHGTLQNKSRFYSECVVGAYFCVVRVFYVQNVGPHRTFKSNLKKKKNFSRPTNPASRRASMDKQTIFFIGLIMQMEISQMKV